MRSQKLVSRLRNVFIKFPRQKRYLGSELAENTPTAALRLQTADTAWRFLGPTAGPTLKVTYECGPQKFDINRTKMGDDLRDCTSYGEMLAAVPRVLPCMLKKGIFQPCWNTLGSSCTGHCQK